MSPQSPAVVAAPSGSILVVSASPASGTRIRGMLAEAGYHARSVRTAGETLAEIQRDQPELVVLALSADDTLALLGRLADHPQRQALGVLAMARGIEPESLLAAGADDVLTSPIAPKTMRLRIATLLRLKAGQHRFTEQLRSRQARELHILQRTARRLAACRTLEAVAVTVVTIVRQELGFTRAHLILWDERTQIARRRAGTNLAGEVFGTTEPAIYLGADSPLREVPGYRQIFQEGLELYKIDDMASALPATLRTWSAVPIRESLFVALRGAERLLGLIIVESLEGGQALPEESEPLLILAGQAAQALERAQLADELRARAEEAETLAEVSTVLAGVLEPGPLYTLILEQTARVLPYDHAAIYACDGDWARMVASRGTPTLPPGAIALDLRQQSGLTLAVAQGSTLRIRDTLGDPQWQHVAPWVGDYSIRSAIIVPLIVDGELLGSFNLDSYTLDFYTAHHAQIATALAERVTQALHNARLYTAERERAVAAEALAQTRNDFVAAVSHELRTPLTAIVGYAELLQARWTQMDDGQRLNRIERIVTAAGRQQRLVEDLLLITQLEQGVLASHIDTVELPVIVQRAADEIAASYRGQRIELRGQSTLQIVADPERTVQIVANLVDNAAKYSAEGSPIVVSWEPDGGCAILRVRDYGPGIPKQGREGLFTRFGRIAGSRTRAGRVGTGLGLYLGRQLAEAMSGSLDLETTGPEGSTFRLCLPLAQR